jgi:bis(5'-nucleosyl)-tetraphosphatase (symmetrical)
VLPQWSAEETVALSAEFTRAMGGPEHRNFLAVMYGNLPDTWHSDLRGDDRLRVVVNALTRLRFCSAQGRMEFETKDGSGDAPPGYMPWFDVPSRRTAGQPIAFGHWSTLRQPRRAQVLALDTGCVWGGCLSAAVLRPLQAGEAAHALEVVQVLCPQAQKPG